MIHLLLLLALIAPNLHATWAGPGSAVITWQQPPGVRQTCLYRYYGARWPAAICWHDLKPGAQTVTIPGTLTHPAYQVAEGDRFVLEFGGVPVGSATLGEARVYRVWVPLARGGPAPTRRVYLPAL